MKSIILAFGLLVVTTLGVSFAQAAEFRTAPSQSGSVVLSGSDTARDLYAAADTITVSIPVKGDLLAAGTTVTVASDVENSLFAVGNSVTIRGNVGHHLRLAGQTVIIDGTINGDVFVAGKTVTVSRNTVISGDLFVAGSSVTIDGTVKGIVKVGGTAVTVNGNVGSVSAYVNSLTVGNGAVVAGDILYRSPTEAAIDSGATIKGKVNYTKSAPRHYRGFPTTSRLLTLLGSIITLLILVRLWPALFTKLNERLVQRFGSSALWGLATLFLGPLLILLLAVTLVGLPLAFLGFLTWVLVVYIGSLIGKLWLGSWVVKSLTKEPAYRLDWQTIVVGVLLTSVLGLIPFIGSLAIFVITLAGIGALIHQLISSRQI